MVFHGAQFSKRAECSVSQETAGNAGDLGSILGLGRSPGEGKSNPLQCSCLENPMAGEAWRGVCYVWGMTLSNGEWGFSSLNLHGMSEALGMRGEYTDR